MVGANVQFDVDGRWNAHGQKTADRVESNFFQDGQKSSSLESGAFQVVRWFQQVDFNKQEDRQEDHNGSIGNTTNTCWNQISESRRWTMASCYLQLLPAFSFHISSPNQSPHAPGITAWIFPYPEVVKFNWLKVVYYRFMMAIGAQRKILKTPQLLNGSEKLESLSLPTTSGLGPGEIKQTQTDLKGAYSKPSQFYLWNGWQSGIKWVCLIYRTYISSWYERVFLLVWCHPPYMQIVSLATDHSDTWGMMQPVIYTKTEES